MFENLASTLFLTAFCYMLVPLIFLMKDGRTEAKRAKRIALWNSVIVGAIFFLLSTASNLQWNAAPAFLYYGINYWILREKQSSI